MSVVRAFTVAPQLPFFFGERQARSQAESRAFPESRSLSFSRGTEAFREGSLLLLAPSANQYDCAFSHKREHSTNAPTLNREGRPPSLLNALVVSEAQFH